VTRSIAVAVSSAVLMTSAAYAAQEPPKFSCSGTMIEPASLAASPKSVQLTLNSATKVAIDLGQGDSNARVLSDNKIQLKFQTKEFVGEFFHYTNDLFLIYKTGHLARLTCTPS
jgi:hypothetical protein